MPGVVDTVSRSTARRRRRSRHGVVKIGRADVFVKHGAPAAVRREAATLLRLEHARRGALPLAPAALACDSRTGRLYVEALSGWPTLHSLFEDCGGVGELASARDLGAALAALHAVDPAGLPAAVSHLPRLELSPLDATKVCGETLALIAHLQRVRGLDAVLGELREDVTQPLLVHGDAKLDNALRGPGHRIVLVDFEHSGSGDPSWDVGAALGDYLSRWLLSVRCAPDAPLAAWLTGAAVPLTRCTAAAREVLAGYASNRPLPDLDRIAAQAGVFLVHRAQAWIERYGRFGAKALLLARCGSRLAVGRWRALEPLVEPPR